MVKLKDIDEVMIDNPKRCNHTWQENFDIGGNFCIHCGEAFEENKKDVYDYVVSIIKNYQPHEARNMINGYVYRDTEMVDMVREQGSVEIGLNRERLANILFTERSGASYFSSSITKYSKRHCTCKSEGECSKCVWSNCLQEADIIISAEATLLERKGNK